MTEAFDVRVIPEFEDTSQPVGEWVEKVELVCRLKEVKDLATVVPLRLTGTRIESMTLVQIIERARVRALLTEDNCTSALGVMHLGVPRRLNRMPKTCQEYMFFNYGLPTTWHDGEGVPEEQW
ncbi:hypothetical protein O3P69_009146 [Scylla paramamosain]|uniref:Uncharacterized protein n=1 Tax=Scylla paramamosain TaxID=85552 RepID=A0AAW0TBP5_SCYPA